MTETIGSQVRNIDGTLSQTFSITLRSQDDILKSIYIGKLPDPAKPTAFNLTDVIGYDLSLQTKPRITPIGRHAGYYQPTALDIIFFRDPLDKHPHDVDIAMLMRLCDVHQIPLATNYKSGHILVKYFKNKSFVDSNEKAMMHSKYFSPNSETVTKKTQLYYSFKKN